MNTLPSYQPATDLLACLSLWYSSSIRLGYICDEDCIYTVLHKKGAFFLSFIIHSNDNQFTQAGKEYLTNHHILSKYFELEFLHL